MTAQKSIPSHDPASIEKKWQKVWREKKAYSPDLNSAKKPYYNLMMFPYPSAEGLHAGNMYAFTGADIWGRYQRMQGNDVFEPMGLDGFGIHSENYAIKIGEHPVEVSKRTEKRFYDQLTATGNGFDWTRTLETYDPDYYRWTQWMFVQMFKNGLAYRKKAKVNWCPSCKTVLADEQVISGECERCSSQVENRDLEQWFFKITDYADRLLDNLAKIDWTEKIKIAQRNWIGRSEGATIRFQVSGSSEQIEVFTTRPDTLYGTTFMVIAPDLPLVDRLITNEQKEAVSKFIKTYQIQKTGLPAEAIKAKEGVFTGSSVINPANKKEIPIYISNYVVSGYGSQGVMGVPAHDTRDWEFAKKYDLEIRPVILPEEKYESEEVKNGVLQRSDNHKEVVVNLATIARENNKKLMLMGGWASATQVGELYREHGDIDMIVLEKELDWWRETLKDSGLELSNMFPEGQNDKYYFQATKPGIHIDVLTFKVEDGEVVSLTGEKPKNLEASFDEMFSLVKIENVPVYAVKPEFIYKWKKDHQEKTKDIRWKEQADFLMLGLEPHTGEGRIINSEDWDGLNWPSDREKILKSLEEKGWGKKETTYHLRDWLISRQRYWGPPIPMIYCETCAEAKKGEREDMPGWYVVPEGELPVELPYVENFKPTGTGEGPLEQDENFMKVSCLGCGANARRETDVSDTFLDSAWYFLRYPSLDSKTAGSKPFDPEITKKWLPVNMYIGGAEHSVLHLMYSRFITMALHDWGYINFEEPFTRFYAHGLLIKEGAKMSKSKGNVIVPDAYIKKYGADTLRAYLMFLSPFDQGGDFRDTGMEGMFKFVRRVWNLVVANSKLEVGGGKLDNEMGSRNSNFSLQSEANLSSHVSSLTSERLVHKAVKRLTEDMDGLRYNRAIAGLMEYVNSLEELNSKLKTQNSKLSKEAIETLLKLFAPFAPHMTEELWHELGHKDSIHFQPWPEFDPALVVDEVVAIPVQVDGKLRGTVEIDSDRDSDREFVERKARENETVAKYLTSEPKKVIFVPGRLINFVI